LLHNFQNIRLNWNWTLPRHYPMLSGPCCQDRAFRKSAYLSTEDFGLHAEILSLHKRGINIFEAVGWTFCEKQTYSNIHWYYGFFEVQNVEILLKTWKCRTTP
jgi:hypothetical protein